MSVEGAFFLFVEERENIILEDVRLFRLGHLTVNLVRNCIDGHGIKCNVLCMGSKMTNAVSMN